MNREITNLRLGLPKGRMQEGVFRLLEEAGISIRTGRRQYRPWLSLEGVEAKLLKPQNIVEMLDAGSRDAGFAGADWVRELDADVVELIDLGLDPVRVVAAAPAGILENGALPGRPLRVATEYVELTRRWIERCGLDMRIVRSRGATEVYPPEDADLIVDNTSTGSTLEANGLVITDELMVSSTRLYASRAAMSDDARRSAIEALSTIVASVVDARRRALLEINVTSERLEAVIALLPCMREPTISQLHGNSGYAVRAAVPRHALPDLVPRLKRAGGTDVIVTRPQQITP